EALVPAPGSELGDGEGTLVWGSRMKPLRGVSSGPCSNGGGCLAVPFGLSNPHPRLPRHSACHGHCHAVQSPSDGSVQRGCLVGLRCQQLQLEGSVRLWPAPSVLAARIDIM